MTDTNSTAKTKSSASPAGCLGGLVFLVMVASALFGLRTCQRSKMSPLCLATADGDLSTVKRLVEAGTDVNGRGGLHDETALGVAAAQGHVEISEYLLNHGARVDLSDSDRYTPLHYCGRWNHKGGPPASTEAARNAIAVMLIGRGANVNAQTMHGETPLHWAVMEDNLELARILLQAKADPNVRQQQGYTPLHLACFSWHDNPAVVTLLLGHGADPSIRDTQGKTPEDHAKELAPKAVKVFAEQAKSR